MIAEQEEQIQQAALSEQAYKDYVARNWRWNFLVNILDVGFYNVSLAVASTSTILPLFVRHLRDEPWLIGLIPAIVALGFGLPGLFAANHAESLERKLPFVKRVTIGERLPYLALALLTFFFAQSNPMLVLVGVYLSLAIMSGTGGVLTPAWLDMISKVIPARIRGRFFAMSNVIGGVIGAGAAWLVAQILAYYPYPSNFALSFGIAFIATMMSMGFLFGNREAPHPAKPGSPNLIAYFRGIPDLLRHDRNFSVFIVCRMLLVLAGMSTAFFTVYAVDHLAAGDGTVGNYTAILLAAQVPANLLLGYIGDKLGYRLVMQLTTVAVILGAFTAIFSPTSVWFALVWIFVAFSTAGNLLINMAMLLEFSTPDKRPTYVAVGMGIGSPASFAAPLIASWVAVTIGYIPLFWISVALGIITLLASTVYIIEPRRAKSRSGTGDIS